MKWVITFLKYQGGRLLAVKALVLSAYYRLYLFWGSMEQLKSRIGVEHEESSGDVPEGMVPYLFRISYAVNHVCKHTPWQSKCLVRALTAQKLLKEKRLDSTLYLGVSEKENKMVAHAWLRCGNVFVTGGDGRDFAMVTKIKCCCQRIGSSKHMQSYYL